MIEIEWRHLDVKERARWAAALEQLPVLHAPPICAELPVLAIAALAGVASCAAATHGIRPYEYGTGLDVSLGWRVAACALGLAWILLCGSSAWWTRSVRRSPLRLGRSLYRWGYVDVRPGRISFVPGAEITHDVSIGRPGLTGMSDVEIRLSKGKWSTVFRLRGSEQDVPTEALESLGTTPFELVASGYRESANASARRTRRRRAVPLWAPHLALAIVGLIVGGSAPTVILVRRAMARASEGPNYMDEMRWTEIEREFPFLWVSARASAARARRRRDLAGPIERALRDPYRAEMLRLLDEPHPGVYSFRDDCSPDAAEVPALNAIARTHAFVGGVSELSRVVFRVEPGLADYFDHDRRSYAPDTAAAEFSSDCTWEIEDVYPTTPPRIALRVHARWRFAARGRPPIERRVDVEPEDVDRIVRRCALVARDAPMIVALTLVERTIRRDVFADDRAQHRGSYLYTYVAAPQATGQVSECVIAAAGDSLLRAAPL